jgi:WhiB family redox-sensing transcriptional regulator
MAVHDLDHQSPRRRPAADARPRIMPPGWYRMDALHTARASSPRWMSRGACRAEDPELFFPTSAAGARLAQVSSAKAVCGRCPVQANCLSYALVTGQYGIWGGTTREERWPPRHPRRSPAAGG